MSSIRWGVLSTAAIALDHVIPAIEALPDSEVVAIASRSMTRAKRAAERHSIPRFHDSYEALLDDDIDCLYIPLPNAQHCAWAVAALERGHAVLVEKPLGVTAHEVRRMIDASRASGVLLAEGFMYRYHPQFTGLLKYLTDGTLGAVRTVRGSINFVISRPNIRLEPELGGGALLDVGVYPLDAMCLLFGAPPVRVQSTADLRDGVDDLCAALLEFPDGGLGLMDCNFRHPWLQAPLEVLGERGVLRLDNAYNPGTGEGSGTLLVDGTEPRRLTFPAVNMYGTMIESFTAALRGDQPPEYPIEASLATATAVDMVRDAWKLAGS